MKVKRTKETDHTRHFLMEALILYFVLFYPGVYAFPMENVEAVSFTMFRELDRTLTYTIPSFILLWYLLSDKKGISALKQEKLCRKDLVGFIIGLPGLIIIGLGISFLVSVLPEYPGMPLPPRVEGPVNVQGWVVMVFSCLGTGYLEESYFRYYLLTKLENFFPWTFLRIIFSTALFSLCHIYEGPWGVFNAVLAGLLLSTLFVRYRSLHGIAWAHGAYNAFVYVMGRFVT
jgi:membrane protease YdiL (CAAX protease family)